MQIIQTWYIRKLVLCRFDLNQKCCRHHHVNQRTVCNYVCIPLHLWKCIRAFAAVCISVCDIILGFKLSSVMPSGKKGHVWFRYDWWLWPTYQYLQIFILIKTGMRSEQALYHVKKWNWVSVWVSVKFQTVSSNVQWKTNEGM